MAEACLPQRCILLFDAPHQVVDATVRLRRAGFRVEEAFTPFRVEGLDEALGHSRTRVGWATLFFGLVGAGGAFGFMTWAHCTSWPMDIGGKPDNAWPAMVPIVFEALILLAAVATALTVLARSRHSPSFGGKPQLCHARVTDDRFAIIVRVPEEKAQRERFQDVLKDIAPAETLGATGDGRVES